MPIPLLPVRPHLKYAVQVWAPDATHGNWGFTDGHRVLPNGVY